MTFLPLLLLLPARADSTPWLRAGFDDILRWPLTKAELLARLTVFLRLGGAVETQFHATVDQVQVGLYRATPEGRLLMANPAFAKMLGYALTDAPAPSATPAFPTHVTYPSETARARLELTDQVSGLETRREHPDGTPLYVRESARVVRDGAGALLYYEGTIEDVTARVQGEEALRRADRHAVETYEQLLDRLANLAQIVGTAMDLETIFSGLRDFVTESTPSNGLFASLYDPLAQMRTCVYAWSEGEEIDVATLPPLPMTDSPNSRAVATGQIIVTDDFQAAVAGSPNILVAGDIDPREPQASISVPMIVMGRVIGGFEVQSPVLAAYRDEHVIALRMAANLAAIAVEHVQALQRERAQRLQTEASEARFHALIRHASDITAVTSAQNRVQYVSPTIERMLGYSATEIIGTNGFAPIHPDDEQRARTFFEELQQTRGPSAAIELRTRHRDGSWRILELIGNNLLHEPAVEGIVVNARDVTERKVAEVARRSSEERLRLVFSTTGMQIWDWDIFSDTVVWSDGRSECLCLDQADGSPCCHGFLDACHPEDRPMVRSALARAIDNGSEYNIEYRMAQPERGIKWVLSRGEVFRDEIGRAERMVGVVIDITARRQAEDEVLRLNADLEERVAARTAELAVANKELESFSYSVSHDLRAPLRAIDGLSQIVLEDFGASIDAEIKSYLDRIRSASQRMAQLIDALLELSRLSRGELRHDDVDLSLLAHQIGAELRFRQPERRVELVVADGLAARGDARLLRAVLDNLLGNAWKFTGAHTTARIEFGSLVQDHQTVYFVRDDGAGFDPAYAGKLFGAFQRLHTAAEFEGAGIGLATVQRIIHRHGGGIWATGGVEQGATFFFTLG